MPQIEGLDGLRHPQRLVAIHGMGAACRDGTVLAAPGADVAQNQERRRACIPTFPDIRTASLFTDGVELEPVHSPANLLVVGPCLQANLEPGRQSTRRTFV